MTGLVNSSQVTGVRGVTSDVGGSPCKPQCAKDTAQGDGVTGVFLLIYEKKERVNLYIYSPLKMFCAKEGGHPVTLLRNGPLPDLSSLHAGRRRGNTVASIPSPKNRKHQ